MERCLTFLIVFCSYFGLISFNTVEVEELACLEPVVDFEKGVVFSILQFLFEIPKLLS